jgi:SAM-dependent methyltransferase
MTSQTELPWARIDSFIGNCTHAALLNRRACPICGCLNDRTLLVFDDFQFYTDSAVEPKRARVQVVQCQDCHGVYLNPCYSKTGFRYLFAEAGQSYGSTEAHTAEQIGWLFERGLLDDGKVFLDVGCYEGKFLSLLPKGVQKLGIDIDAPAIARGQVRYGADEVELINGAFETFMSPIEPDVISMFHVLEHLPDPHEVLRHLRSISHDETRLVIEVPVLEQGATNDINGFLSVQHMTHFSQHSLGQLMMRSGWTVLERQQISDYNGHRLLAKPGESFTKATGSAVDRTHVLHYLGQWYRNLAEISRLVEAWQTINRMVIWGGGAHSEFAYQVTPVFQQNSLREYLIIDSDPLKQGKSWRGVSILSPEILRVVDWNSSRLLISSYGSQEVIAQAAASLGVPDAAIYRLYSHVEVY